MVQIWDTVTVGQAVGYRCNVLTVLAALKLLAVLLLEGQLSLQLGNASLGQLPTQLLVFLNQHSTLGHQFLPCLAVRETSLTSHGEPGDKQQAKRSHWSDPLCDLPRVKRNSSTWLSVNWSNHNTNVIKSFRLQNNIRNPLTQICPVQTHIKIHGKNRLFSASEIKSWMMCIENGPHFPETQKQCYTLTVCWRKVGILVSIRSLANFQF